MTAPPSPMTSILLIMIRFLVFVRSIFESTKTLKPLDAIKPYKTIEIPPITQLGIAEIKAIKTLLNERIMAKIAASPVTHTEATFVIPTTDVFSP